MKKSTLLSIFIFLLFNITYSQVGVGTTTPDQSAVLDVTGNNGGVLVPRLLTTERDNIFEPANSLLIFNADESVFQYNAGTTLAPDWKNLNLADTLKLNSSFNSGSAAVIQSYLADNSAISTLLINPGGGHVGINVDDEASVKEALVVNGAIQLSSGGYTGITDGANTPVPDGGAGTIVFSDVHFFVWSGSQWSQID